MTRANATQAAIGMASAERAFAELCAAAAIREAIRPIARRNVAKLAAIVAASPIGERREANRRANRAGR